MNGRPVWHNRHNRPREMLIMRREIGHVLSIGRSRLSCPAGASLSISVSIFKRATRDIQTTSSTGVLTSPRRYPLVRLPPSLDIHLSSNRYFIISPPFYSRYIIILIPYTNCNDSISEKYVHIRFPLVRIMLRRLKLLKLQHPE